MLSFETTKPLGEISDEKLGATLRALREGTGKAAGNRHSTTSGGTCTPTTSMRRCGMRASEFGFFRMTIEQPPQLSASGRHSRSRSNRTYLAARSLHAHKLKEVVQLLDAGVRTIAIHGESGHGKSCLLYEVCGKLRASGVPTLPLRLDRQGPTQDLDAYGRALGLPAAPHFTLAALSSGRKAVLVIDQLDSVQWTGTSPASTVAAFERLCRESLDHDELSVVVACRSFDLEHEDLLKSWSEAQDLKRSTSVSCRRARSSSSLRTPGPVGATDWRTRGGCSSHHRH